MVGMPSVLVPPELLGICTASVGFHCLVGIEYHPFGDVEWLCVEHLVPPILWLTGRQHRITQPLCSDPRYRGFITTTSCPAPTACIDTFTLVLFHLRLFSFHHTVGSHVPYESLCMDHAAFIPVTIQSVARLHLDFSCDCDPIAVSITSEPFEMSSAVHFRSSSIHPSDRFTSAFSLTLSTIGFVDSTLR